jgi:hypothetical protein
MHQKSTKYYLLIYVTKFGQELKSNFKDVAKIFARVFSTTDAKLFLFTPEHKYGEIVPL